MLLLAACCSLSLIKDDAEMYDAEMEIEIFTQSDFFMWSENEDDFCMQRAMNEYI